LVRLANQRGIRVIDAADWCPLQEDFEDNLHMSKAGVAIFSERLARELSANPVQTVSAASEQGQ
jgi:lysophospholipase L1-like esterase